MYDEEKINRIPEQVKDLIRIIRELESDFPNRRFTLDGHLLGSIGEVIASFHYGISLFPASVEIHDGTVDSRQIQIKITQQDRIIISGKPEYLLVLYLRKDGSFYEVYNGPGDIPWEVASSAKNGKGRYIRINKLMELDNAVDSDHRIPQIHPMAKMKKEYKNRA